MHVCLRTYYFTKQLSICLLSPVVITDRRRDVGRLLPERSWGALPHVVHLHRLLQEANKGARAAAKALPAIKKQKEDPLHSQSVETPGEFDDDDDDDTALIIAAICARETALRTGLAFEPLASIADPAPLYFLNRGSPWGGGTKVEHEQNSACVVSLVRYQEEVCGSVRPLFCRKTGSTMYAYFFVKSHRPWTGETLLPCKKEVKRAITHTRTRAPAIDHQPFNQSILFVVVFCLSLCVLAHTGRVRSDRGHVHEVSTDGVSGRAERTHSQARGKGGRTRWRPRRHGGMNK